jgi:hypothetical protein
VTVVEGGTMSKKHPEAPIACDLSALDANERKRRSTLAAKLHSAVRDRRELADGYALRVAEDKISIGELGDWMKLEGKCCPFLSFALVPEGRMFWLHLSGGAGVKNFLKSVMQ